MPKTKSVTLEDLGTALAPSQVSSVTTDERTALEGLVDELRRIDERAELAIQTVSQAIKTQAVVAKGTALLNVERRLQGFTEENRNERLLPLLADLGGPSEREAKTWMAAAMSVEQNAYLAGGEDFLLNFTPNVLQKLNTLPEGKRADVIEEAIKEDKPVSAKKVKEVAEQPDTKAEKAQEELAVATSERDRLTKELEALKRDMTVVTDDPEYIRVRESNEAAAKQVESLENKVEELKKEARTYKQQAYEANKKLGDIETSTEEQEEEAKKIRIRKISSTLPNRLPDLLADIQRFHNEESSYDEEVREIITNQIRMLAAFIIPNYVES